LAANTEEFLCEQELNMLPKEYRVFIHRDYPSNTFLLNVIKRNIPVRQYLLPLFDVCHKLGGLGVSSSELTKRLGYHHRHLVPKTKQHLFLTDQEIEQAHAEIRNLGFDPSRPFIPVLGRDASYLAHIKEPTDMDSYRNVDINNFIPAMEHLADTYPVIRMGSVVRQNLNTQHKNILDYSSSGKRSELLDVYLSSHCHFFLTCSTGPDSIAMYCFRRPVLVVNLVPIDCIQNFETQTLFIFKKYWSHKEERYLSLKELVDTGIGEKYTPRELNQLDIVIHDNTPDEILSATQEMVARMNGSWVDSPEDKERQTAFWKVIHKRYQKETCISQVASTYLRLNPFLLD